MTTPQSPETHLVFSQTIDILFRKTLAAHFTPEVTEGVRRAGIDLSKPLDPAYPLRVFDDAMEVVAERGMAPMKKADALRKIGELQVEAFTTTFLGKATFGVLRLIPRERLLNRMARSWRQANNFVESTVAASPDGSLVLRINDVGRFPEVIQGVQYAAFRAAGHRVAVEIGRRDGLACEYLLRFS